MKYLDVQSIRWALSQVTRLNDQNSSNELVTEFVKHYFPIGRFSSWLLEETGFPLPVASPVRLIAQVVNNVVVPHALITGQPVTSESFGEIASKIVQSEGLIDAIDWDEGNYGLFIIIIKGAKVALFEYTNLESMLEQADIKNFSGLIPLNEIISLSSFQELNPNATGQDYFQYLITKNAIADLHLPGTDAHLTSIGVENSTAIEKPHIWDFLNRRHEHYVHDLFQAAANTRACDYINE